MAASGAKPTEKAGVAERLRARKGEIEQTAIARVHAIADPHEASEPDYAENLRLAVSVALDYGIATLEASAEQTPRVPPVLLAQARLAAASRVSLDTVLRRYVAGYALFGNYLLDAAEEVLAGPELKHLMQRQAGTFDRLLAAVSEEYGKERERRQRSPEQRRAERVQRMLDGEPLDASELAYELDAWHLGVVAVGPDAAEAPRALAEGLDRNLLLVRPDEDTVWAWLGGRKRLDSADLPELAPVGCLALGEPGQGRAGWLLTHRQARAALTVARRQVDSPVHYADVALLATALRDDLFAASLHQLYLRPLQETRDGGKTARETLRAYLAAEQNVTSAAARLGVSRHTVKSRLHAIERKLGRSVNGVVGQLEVALSLEATDTEVRTSLADTSISTRQGHHFG